MGLICDLIANENTQFTEDDRVWLKELDDEQVKRMFPVNVKKAEDMEEDEEEESKGKKKTTGNAAERDVSLDTDDDPRTVEEYVENAPEEIREVLNSSLAMHRSKKEALVQSLTANKRCRFTEKQLKTKTIEELEALAELANVPKDYSAAAPTGNTENSEGKVEPLGLPEYNWKKD